MTMHTYIHTYIQYLWSKLQIEVPLSIGSMKPELGTSIFPRGFSEITVILAELVHMKETPTSMGPEPAMTLVFLFVVRCGISYRGSRLGGLPKAFALTMCLGRRQRDRA